MKCDICDQEFANSEEIKVHKERVHPLDEREEVGLEEPDPKENAPESEPEPVPVIRPIGQ